MPSLRVPIEEWNIPDPIGQDEQAFRKTADLLEQQVMRLVLQSALEPASVAEKVDRVPGDARMELRTLAAYASSYLGYPCSATLLGGGVSNTVLLIESATERFILKQSLGKLRVEQDWFSDRARIFRESSAMRQLAAMFPPGSLPTILSETTTTTFSR